MIIADVDFPQPLLNALRDGQLVVFAGAGVSMAPPALLPDFRGLALRIAEGTGLTIGEFEPEDRFLGRLKDAGPDVHRRAVQILQANDPKPTELHRNLLGLYTGPENVRIVTTNFDRLFEQAAADLYDLAPKVFQAPALPLGQRFQGLVHIHGAVDEPTEMVLTSQDFGRAYLTEADGWARRFLVDLFANYTVLFVGYSHQDTIMTYLTPSLPPESSQKRFALIGDWKSEEQGHWRRMGVEPVAFQQADADDFVSLDSAVAGLADQISRGTLDWQREIAAIASRYPPVGTTDDERAGIIEHALSDPVETRFFVESAELPEWIEWLDRRGHLTALFNDGELSQQDQRLIHWLISRFALTHDSTLFALMGRHGHRLNPVFWRLLSLQMQHSDQDPPEPAVLTRWVLFLASVIPKEADEFALAWLAEACASVGATDGLLRVYEALTERFDRAPPSAGWASSVMFHYEMQKMLSEHIKPNLAKMAEPLLALTTMRLNARQAVSNAWGQRDPTWGSDNIRRSAIEPHEQDDDSGEVDPLVDVARECLEWLATNRPDAARLWSERHSRSRVPLLRRLVVHTLSVRTDLSPDDKIAWLLERCDIHDIAAHHETFRATSIIFPQAGSERRSDLIDAVLAYRWTQATEPDTDLHTAMHHFTWLNWLSEAAPECELTSQALDDIRNRHPEFQPYEHPDFFLYHQTGMQSGDQSPWTAVTLLAQPAAEALPDLVAYQPTERERFEGHDRWAMLRAVEEAVQTNASWGLELADAMTGIGEWNSDLWYHIIVAWAKVELDQDGVKRMLSHLSSEGLHQQRVREIARTLLELVRKTNGAETTRLRGEANSLAAALHQHANIVEVHNSTPSVGGVLQDVDWLETAINHPSGILAQFWAESIALWCRQQAAPPQTLNYEYRAALDGIVQDDSIAGKLGRTVLARYTPLLLWVDETWTRQNLIPLLDHDSSEFLSAWDGLTYCRQMTPQTAELLKEPFLKAVEHVNRDLAGSRQERFITRYVGLLVWFASDPADEWITKLLTHCDSEARHRIAMEISSHLRSADAGRQKTWWSTWLKGYWENRLLGVPVQLDDAEIDSMLYWTTLLSAVFPEAVDLAIQMRAVQLQHGIVIFQIEEGNLVDQYPESVAKLLIHLGKTDQKPWTWYRAKKIFDELLLSNLDSETEASLRETMARIAAW